MPDPQIAIMDCLHPNAVCALVLHYSQLRSQYQLAKAFWDKFPTELEWQTFLCSPEFLHGVDEFAQVMADMREVVETGDVMSAEAVQNLGGQNHERAMYAVEELEQVLGVAGEEIISASL